MNGGHHPAGPIGAKPDVVPAGWAETRVVEDAVRETTSFTGWPVWRAATAASTVCICSEFFWPKPPPVKGEITSTCSALRPSALARPCRMASAFWVPSRMMSLSPCHSAIEAISSIGFWCCGGQLNTRIDLDRRFGESLAGVSGNDLGEKVLQRRVRLVDGFGAFAHRACAERLVGITWPLTRRAASIAASSVSAATSAMG